MKVTESDTSEPMEWLKPFLSMCWSFVFIGIYCESGEFVTDQFERFNDVLGQSSWYQFPNEVQQMILILMTNSQQPTFIRGFGNIICAREAFKRVNTCCLVEKRKVYSMNSYSITLILHIDIKSWIFIFYGSSSHQ